jgi:hypothetical protein
MRRFGWLCALASTLACAAGLVVNGGAASASGGRAAASGLPTLNLALTGTRSISVSGSEVSGAVNVVSTFTGRGVGIAALVRLDPGATLQQAFQAVQSHRGDMNALGPYGSVVFDADAPSTTQTVLTPGNYVALNIPMNGNGAPAFAEFTVSASSSPATLPAPKATETAIEFGFTGPSVLHDGTIVRAQNGGYLVHMITLIGVRNAAVGNAVTTLLRAGKGNQAQRLSNGNFLDLLGPASSGAMQQAVLSAEPGYYVEACFMDTQDHREHVRLGMERLVRIVR